MKYAKDQPAGFLNHIKKVTVVGAGGQIGKHLVRALLEAGKFEVTAVQRSNSTNEIPEGIRVVRVEYSDKPALVEALRGQQALVITMAVTAPRDTVGRLVAAAAEAGVEYIMPNWFGHDAGNDRLCRDSLLMDFRDGVREQIERLGVSKCLLLVCNFWYEFSLAGGVDRFGFDFKMRRLVWFDDGDVRFNVSTWPQCGRAVAGLMGLKCLPEDEGDASPALARFGDGCVYISSFRVSQRDMFESVKRVTGTTDQDWDIGRASSRQRWGEGMAAVKEGDFGAFTKMLYSRMFFPGGDGDYESRRGLDNQVLGLPVDDLDEWTAVAVRMGENGEVVHAH